MRYLSALMLLLICGGLAPCGTAQAQDAPAVPDMTAATPTAPAAVAPAGAIQIALPFNKAIVRETVSVTLRDFPQGGYASISIDGQFITAQALPPRRTDPVYVWDTKTAPTTPDDPNGPRGYRDGPHTITIAVYDKDSALVGRDTVMVTVANRINLPSSQGIKLAYPWKINLALKYQRRTDLVAAPADAATGQREQTVQESLLRYRRTVDNTLNGSFLIRDEVLPTDRAYHKTFVSTLTTRGQQQPLSFVSSLRDHLRVVDTRGRVVSEITPQSEGETLGFSIPVLPPRRVSVGAHWESPVQMTLDWFSPYPTTVLATGTLEDFEWQDRYPTAKIRETYTGPATFNPRPGSPLPRLSSQDIHFERIIYFAYNSGRVVRTETTLTLTTTSPGLLAAVAAPTSPGYGPGNPSGPGYPPGGDPSGLPGPPGMPGIPGPQFPPPGGGYSPPGGPYSPSGPGQFGRGGEAAPTRLQYTETSVILI